MQQSFDLSLKPLARRVLSTPCTLWTIKDVLLLTKFSRVTIYRLIRDGRFPAPVAVSGRSNRWREDDIMAWEDSLDHRKYGS